MSEWESPRQIAVRNIVSEGGPLSGVFNSARSRETANQERWRSRPGTAASSTAAPAAIMSRSGSDRTVDHNIHRRDIAARVWAAMLLKAEG